MEEALGAPTAGPASEGPRPAPCHKSAFGASALDRGPRCGLSYTPATVACARNVIWRCPLRALPACGEGMAGEEVWSVRSGVVSKQPGARWSPQKAELSRG